MNKDLIGKNVLHVFGPVPKEEWESLMSLIPEATRGKVASLFIRGFQLSECALGLRIDGYKERMTDKGVPFYEWKVKACRVVDKSGNFKYYPLSDNDWMPDPILDRVVSDDSRERLQEERIITNRVLTEKWFKKKSKG